MATVIAVPQEYGYVVLTATSTFLLSIWHGARSGVFRRQAGIRPPKSYAESADMSSASPEKKKAMYLFNCAQRAHGNYLENQPNVTIAMLLCGLRYPIATTVMGVAWMVGRIVFALGYTRADKENGQGRLMGSPMWLFQFGLFGLTAWTGLKMVI